MAFLKSRTCKHLIRRIVILLFSVLLFTACDEPFSISSLVDGPDGKPLSLSPSKAVLVIGNSITLEPSGGIPPYSYTILSGGGSIIGNTFIAPSPVPATVRLRVTDAAGNQSDAVYTIVDDGLGLGISPSALTVSTNDSFTFSAQGGVPPYTFAVISGPGSGTINSATGEYDAPGTPGTATIEVTDDNLTTRTATVQVIEGLNIMPQVVSVPTNNNLTFSAGGGSAPYTFSMESGNGVVTSGGVYTAPSVTGTDYVRVTDNAGRSRVATVTITPQQPLNITPSSIILLTGSSFSFTATGGTAPYTFSKINGGGSITGGGVYTAGGVPGIAVVRVSDSDSPTKTADAVITIVNIGPLSITPTSVTVEQGTSYTFTTSGGTPQYTYSVVSGTGFVNSSTGEYAAPTALGTETVRVTDASLAISEATVNVAPAAPTNLVVDGTWPGPQDIRLTWTDNASGEDGYRIERKTSGGTYSEIATVGPDVTVFDDLGLTPNIPYSYRVRAYKDPNPDFSGYSNDDFDIPNS